MGYKIPTTLPSQLPRHGVQVMKTANEQWIANGAEQDFGPWTEVFDTDGYFPFEQPAGWQTMRIPAALAGLYLQMFEVNAAGGGSPPDQCFTSLTQRDISAAYARYATGVGALRSELVASVRAVGEDIIGSGSMTRAGGTPGGIAPGAADDTGTQCGLLLLEVN